MPAKVQDLLNDASAKVRMAEALVDGAESKQALVEIRLALQCVARAENGLPARRSTDEKIIRLPGS